MLVQYLKHWHECHAAQHWTKKLASYGLKTFWTSVSNTGEGAGLLLLLQHVEHLNASSDVMLPRDQYLVWGAIDGI